MVKFVWSVTSKLHELLEETFCFMNVRAGSVWEEEIQQLVGPILCMD